MKRYYLMMEHGMDIRHLPNWVWMSMIFDAPRETVSVAPAMIIPVTESVVLMAKQDQSSSTNYALLLLIFTNPPQKKIFCPTLIITLVS